MGNELDDIKNNNIKIIKDNIKKILENFNENDLINKKIDEIYAEIIKVLIKTNKIDDFNYTIDIINQLDLENIIISKTIFETIKNILGDENVIKKYIIKNKEDFNEKKINFYYILLKYILKDPIYIYQIPFLYKTKKQL